jgi:hypothetical protein
MPQVVCKPRNNPNLSQVSNRSNELSFIEASRSNHSVLIGERPKIKPIKVIPSSRCRSKVIDLFGKQNESKDGLVLKQSNSSAVIAMPRL